MTTFGATSYAVLVEYISTLLSMLCLPVNIIFVWLIFKERKRPPYGSSFFRLCIHLSVADILMAIFSLVFFKFPIFGWFPESAFRQNWAVIPIAGVNYFGHSQAIGIVFIAVNRFTAVYYPIKHKQKWWNPTVTTYLLIAQWVVPVFLALPLFFTEFTFLTDPQTGSVIFTASDPIVHKVYFMGMAIVDGVVVNIIVSALYVLIFFRVRQHVVVRRPGELVMRLALSAFIIFISYLALGVFSVLSALTPPTDAWMYRTLWFVVNDVLCASNAPVLLALNRPIRKLFLKKLGIKLKSTVTKGSSLMAHV